MTLQLNSPSYKQQSSRFYHLTFKSEIPRVIQSNSAAMSFVFIYQPQIFRVSSECLFITFIFLHWCFLHVHTGRQTQPRGRRGGGIPCTFSWLQAWVCYGCTNTHCTMPKAAVPPPSHSAMVSSPVLGREVNLGPAASPRLSSGQQSRCSGRAQLQCSGWVFSPQQLTVLLS